MSDWKKVGFYRCITQLHPTYLKFFAPLCDICGFAVKPPQTRRPA